MPTIPAEGIWFCRRCMRDRVFITSVACEGRSVPDAPLFCDECDWEMTCPSDTVIPPTGPPIINPVPMTSESRRIGRERLRLRLLEELGHTPSHDVVRSVDKQDLAQQIAQLTNRGSSR